MKTFKIVVLTGWLGLAAAASSQAQAVVSAPILEGQGFVQSGLQATLKGLEAKANVLIDKGVVEQTLTKTYSLQNMLLHKEWYAGLLQISAAVRNYRRVAHIFERQTAMLKIYSDYISKFRVDPNITPSQLSAMTRSYAGIIGEGGGMLDDLKTIVNPIGAKMTDAERMDLIDALDEKVTHQYDLLVYFTRRNLAISQQQATSAADRATIKNLYGLN